VALPILVKVTGKSVKFIDGYSIFFLCWKARLQYCRAEHGRHRGGGERGGGAAHQENAAAFLLLEVVFLIPLPTASNSHS